MKWFVARTLPGNRTLLFNALEEGEEQTPLDIAIMEVMQTVVDFKIKKDTFLIKVNEYGIKRILKLSDNFEMELDKSHYKRLLVVRKLPNTIEEIIGMKLQFVKLRDQIAGIIEFKVNYTEPNDKIVLTRKGH